jgi:beta-mannosidase
MDRMTTVLPLEDGWELHEALGETWRWRVGLPAAGLNNVGDAVGGSRGGWFPARVPGTVLDDLVRDGQAPDPRHGLDSRAGEWAATRSWVYRRIVDVPPLAEGDRVVLELDGVDPGGIVLWDGVEAGSVDGMFAAARIALPDEPGRHQLTIVVPPVPETEPQVGRTERVRRLAPRMTAGWDFVPRMPHQGVWRPARIRIGAVQLARVTADARVEDGAGVVDVDVAIEAPEPVALRVALARAGRVVARVEVEAAPGRTGVELRVDDPELWWPRGLGDAALYDVAVEAGDGADRRALVVGFRTLDWHANPGSPGDALLYSLAVNGREVSLTGWNWVPVDARYGTTDGARIRHLVDLAARSGGHLLRVWGGGLLETEEFYAACDAAGMLVWQEFPQSSSGMQSAPARDPGFVAHAVAVAEEALPRLAGHPSLVLLGGGNELEDEHGPLADDRSPVLAALHDAVARLASGRGWLPTSPTGPVFHNRLDRIQERPDDLHDVHGPWEHQGLVEHYTLYNAGVALAHTEFGVEGMTNRRALDALVPAEQQWPADRGNPVYRHLGEWWDNAPLVQDAFGGRLADVGAMLRASQLLQATGLQYAVEADRRRAPRASMVLPWQLHESFPNAWCTSSVDYHGEPKPAYHAVARAFAADRVTLRIDRIAAQGAALSAEAWLWSRDGVAAGSSVVLRLRDAAGAVLDETRATAETAIGAPEPVVSLTVAASTLPADAIVLWDAEWRDADGALVDREIGLASTGADLTPLLDLAPADVVHELRIDGDRWEVRLRHRGGAAAIGLALHDARPVEASGWPVAADDPRPLLPGEERTIEVAWDGGYSAERALRLDGWNVAARELPSVSS